MMNKIVKTTIHIVAIAGVLTYVTWILDIIPDTITGFGFVDDAVIGIMAALFVKRLTKGMGKK